MLQWKCDKVTLALISLDEGLAQRLLVELGKDGGGKTDNFN